MCCTGYIRIVIMVLIVFAFFFNPQKGDTMQVKKSDHLISLPSPSLDGKTSVETALQNRRSVRSYAKEPLTLEDIAQLMWAAQGITSPRKLRTAPSAGALYPLEVYVVCGNVTDLDNGIYRYVVDKHQLELVRSGDHRSALASAGLGQAFLREAPAVFVFTGVPPRITQRYGQRGIQYMMMEVGHAAQNLCLQAVARQLATVPVGAFKEDGVKEILQIDDPELPLYLVPVGKEK